MDVGNSIIESKELMAGWRLVQEELRRARLGSHQSNNEELQGQLPVQFHGNSQVHFDILTLGKYD